MSNWTSKIPEAARDYLAGRRLDEIECIVPDIAGVARGKAMPAFKFDKQTHFYLPTSIFLQTITGDWAKFNPQTNKLVVGGKVKLAQGSTVLQGNELHADLNTDKVEMKGGRVKGSFLPK